MTNKTYKEIVVNKRKSECHTKSNADSKIQREDPTVEITFSCRSVTLCL